MRIGYEAKRIFHNSTGLGNYSRSLIDALAHYFPEDEYLLYNPKKGKVKFPDRTNVQQKLPKGFVTQKLNSWWRRYGIASDALLDQVDIFHGLSGELPKKLKSAKIPTVVTIHDLIFERYPKWYKKIDRKIYRKKFKSAAKSADVVVSISEQTKEDLVRYYGIHPDKIQVIKQGCNPVFNQVFEPAFTKQVQEKFNLPEKYFLFVGTLEERKNALKIVHALKQLPEDVHLVLIGKQTDYWNSIQSDSKELGLSQRVHHRAPTETEELAAIYQEALALVYPSIFEGFGIPIVEALYSRTPVITTNGGVFPEAGGPHSIYVNPHSSAEIAEAMLLLLNNADLRNKMKEEGYAFAQQFNPEVVAKQYHDLYLRMTR